MKKKVLLFPGAWSRAEDAFAPQIEYLKNSYDVILPNIHQFNSISKMSNFVVENYTEVYALIGLSMGGFIVQDILTKQPKFAPKAILLGTFAHQQSEDAKKFFNNLILQIKSGKLPELCSLYAQDMLSKNTFLTNSDLVKKLMQIPMALNEQICINHSEACISWDGCIKSLKNILANVLILGAEYDQAAPIEGHKELQKLIPNSVLQIIKSSGHFMTLEKPSEVNKLIMEWLHPTN